MTLPNQLIKKKFMTHFFLESILRKNCILVILSTLSMRDYVHQIRQYQLVVNFDICVHKNQLYPSLPF